MTRRGRSRPGEDQLWLNPDCAVPPEIERARALRKSRGLQPSLSSPEVLANVVAAFRAVPRRSHGGLDRHSAA